MGPKPDHLPQPLPGSRLLFLCPIPLPINRLEYLYFLTVLKFNSLLAKLFRI